MPSLKTMATEMVPAMLMSYARHEMIESIKRQKEAQGDNPEKQNSINKLCLLKLAQGAAILRLASPEHPSHAAVCSAIVGPVLDDTDYPEDNEDAEREGRKIVKRMVKGGVGAFTRLLDVYIHEHSHAAVGRSFGYAPTVHAEVVITEQEIEGKGVCLGIEIMGGTCRHATDTPIPPEHKAPISVAGFMGELMVPALAFVMSEDSEEGAKSRIEMTRDKFFWHALFRAIHEVDEEEGDDGDTPKRNDNVFVHTSGSGAKSDALDLYESAPDKDARLAAMLKAGEVLDVEAKNIWDAALDSTCQHLSTVNAALKLRTLAHMLCERAQMGEFGEAFVSEIPSPVKATLQ